MPYPVPGPPVSRTSYTRLSVAVNPNGVRSIRIISGVRQLPTQQLGDERDAEGDVHLPALERLAVELEREVVPGDLVARLGHRTQVLRLPDSVGVTVYHEAVEHPGRDRRPLERTHARHQLDVVEREGDVGGVSLRVGDDRVAQEKMLRPHKLPAEPDGEQLLRRRLRQVVAKPLGEAGPLTAQIRHRGAHVDRV